VGGNWYLDEFLLEALAAHCCHGCGVVCGGVGVTVSLVLVDRSARLLSCSMALWLRSEGFESVKEVRME
jgi:hypothetical protein